MNLIGKLQPVIIITVALFGLLLGAVTPLGKVSSSLIEVFLMLLLYILFLSIDLKQIKKSFTNVRFTLSAVIITSSLRLCSAICWAKFSSLVLWIFGSAC